MSVRCPKCNSERIAYFRLDSDWGYGGDWSQVNDDSCYTEADLRDFDANDRHDVECCYCIECTAAFD